MFNAPFSNAQEVTLGRMSFPLRSFYIGQNDKTTLLWKRLWEVYADVVMWEPYMAAGHVHMAYILVDSVMEYSFINYNQWN